VKLALWVAVIAAIAVLGMTVVRARRRFQLIAAVTDPKRVARGVPMTLVCEGPRLWLFVAAGASNHTVDLAVGGGRFVMASGEGVFVDRSGDEGPKISAVRCPGPGRLTIEGELLAVGAPRGSWRADLSIPDAEGWADDLKAFVA
jgi:hypothetical protein